METYPILLDGALCGKLTVERQGPKTVFRAECRMREELVRISVYGGGKEGFLGLLCPEDGKLRLEKIMSRSAMAQLHFPESIEFAGRSGLPDGGAGELREEREPAAQPETPASQEPEEIKTGAEVEAESESENKGESESEGEIQEQTCAEDTEVTSVSSPEETDTPEAEAEVEPSACPPEPEPEPEPEQGLDWYSSPDGALVCFDGVGSRIALPLGDSRIPKDISGERRSIDGNDYLVFRSRNGRIVRE